MIKFLDRHQLVVLEICEPKFMIFTSILEKGKATIP